MARKNPKNGSTGSSPDDLSKQLRAQGGRQKAYNQSIKTNEQILRDEAEKVRIDAALRDRVNEVKAAFSADENKLYQAGMQSLKLKGFPFHHVTVQEEWNLIQNIKSVKDESDSVIRWRSIGKRVHKSVAFGRPRRKSVPKPSTSEVQQIASNLASKHGVNVGYVETNKELFSDDLIQRSVSENSYYISAEDPNGTSKTADYLIRYEKERKQQEAEKTQARKRELLSIAHDVQTEKSNQTALDVAPIIKGIIRTYEEANGGKSPSFHKIADALNEQKTPTPRGQEKWYAQTVKRILSRIDTQHQK